MTGATCGGSPSPPAEQPKSEGVLLNFANGKAKRQDSPFEVAPKVVRRPKIFLWGDTGTKKTRTILEFPKPVVIDCEGGTELYGATTKFERIVTSDFDEADRSILWLLRNKHDFATVGIDPITVLWESVQRKWRDLLMAGRRKNNPNASEDFDFQPLDWQKIKGDLKSFIHKLIMLDATVIVTARQKDLRAGEGRDFMKRVGETFDGEKSLPYLFDIVVRTFKSDDGHFMGECLKDRSNKMPKGSFALGYEVFASAFGQKELTRKSKGAGLATEEQCAALRAAFARKKLAEETINRSLSKYDAERVEDLSTENADIILQKLN